VNTLARTPEQIAFELAPEYIAPTALQRFKKNAGWLMIAALFVFSLWHLGINWSRLFVMSDVTAQLLSGLLRPTPGEDLFVIGYALLETLAMAIAGTFLAILLALPFGFIGAKTLISNPVAHGSIRFAYDIMRAIPALIWTIIMIRAVGLGPAAGVIALALAEAPYLANLFAEILENADRRPVVALRAAGAGPAQAIRLGLVTQVLPSFAGLSLFFVEINVRAAAALGVVGAGGIGLMMSERMGIAAFEEVSFLVLVLLATVIIVDFICSRLRRSILSGQDIWKG